MVGVAVVSDDGITPTPDGIGPVEDAGVCV